jgi:arylsulfatase A-like enzyme
MTNSEGDRTVQTRGHAAMSGPPLLHPRTTSAASSPHRPTAPGRGPRRWTRADPPAVQERPGVSESAPGTLRAPGLLSLIGVALGVGAASGFLELAVLTIRVHILHRVGISTLEISRHVSWMVPVAETLVVLGLTLGLGAPALARSSRRVRGPDALKRDVRVCRYFGAILGTLLFLGPLLTVRRLHAVAALALAVGAGVRSRKLLVRPTPGWRRGACWAGALVLVGLPAYSYWQWARVVGAEGRAWSRPPRRAANLLWIVMDTVRADHMSLYGYERPTTPELERWAGEAITFERARSAAPWTLPSHVTMFTGLWPFEHGARIDHPYCGPSPTLAEYLAANGYTTAGLAGNTGMCNATYGVGRGFDYYVELLCNHEVSLQAALFNSALGPYVMRLANAIGLPVPRNLNQDGKRRAPELIGHAQEWLERVHRRNEGVDPGSQRPFFLFINFMDVHSPYLPQATTARRFWTESVPSSQDAVPSIGWRAIQARDAAPPDRLPQFQQELDTVTRRLVDLYDDCLHGLDAQLGRFLGELRASGRLDETWVVITSDHGEHFGEHHVFGHGAGLYDQVTHVPLMLIPPLGSPGTKGDPHAALRGRVVGVPVSHRDLPATLTGLLLPGARNPFRGRSLARHWEPATPGSPDPILAQMEEQRFDGEEVHPDFSRTLDSVIAEDHLLIESSQKGPELYDLLADPKNQRDLAGQPSQRDRLERLTRILGTLRPPPAGR